MTELRACPYCGGEAKVDPYSKDAANCVNAFSGAENATCRNDAILTVDEWNTRPVEDAQAASIAKNDAEIERLTEALEFYANPNNWEPRVATESDAVLDGGEIARAAREREVKG